jgi:hypothetical protein
MTLSPVRTLREIYSTERQMVGYDPEYGLGNGGKTYAWQTHILVPQQTIEKPILGIVRDPQECSDRIFAICIEVPGRASRSFEAVSPQQSGYA